MPGQRVRAAGRPKYVPTMRIDSLHCLGRARKAAERSGAAIELARAAYFIE